MSITTLELMRHGDTGQRSYRGQLDDPLSALGWQQLRDSTADGQWDAVAASTLQRCARFAEELARARELPLQLDDRLREYHFGQWQGVPVEQLHREQAAALGRFWADPVAYPPPGAESFEDFGARLVAALNDIAARFAGQRVLVVTHGGVIKQVLSHVQGRSFDGMAALQVPHASRHVISWSVP